jgi:hypothetical protein
MNIRRPRISRLIDLEKRAESLLERAMEARDKPACEHFSRKVVVFDRLAWAAVTGLRTYSDFD